MAVALSTSATPFRKRLLELADEHEELRRAFDTLTSECEGLRAQLAAAAEAAAKAEAAKAKAEDLESAPLPAIDDAALGGQLRDLLAPDGSLSPLRLRDSKADDDGDGDGGSPARNRAALAVLAKTKDAVGDDDDAGSDGRSRSYASSSSQSGKGDKKDGGRKQRRRKDQSEKQRRGHKSGGVRRRHRRREKSRGRPSGHGGRNKARSGRSRSRSGSRSRSRRARASSDGNFGTGDHRQDLDGFINKNQLEARVAHALRTMTLDNQKKVMGTDGGENSFLLIDRVKSPNAVVMSRIRKLEGR